MRGNKITALLLSVLLLMQCVPVFTAAAAQEQGTQLYYQTAPTSLA